MIHQDRLSFRQVRADDHQAIKSILVDTMDAFQIDLPENYSFADIEDTRRAYLDAKGAFMVFTQAQRLIGFFGSVPVVRNMVSLTIPVRAYRRGMMSL